jgi:tetratricopeptide (TPR) repeat protein
MSATAGLARSLLGSMDVDALSELAERALQEGEEEQALPLLEQAAGSAGSALLWQWKGLLERSLDEIEIALESFAEAARLAPDDPSIAHGRARLTMEAGLDARDLYERAIALEPQNGELLIGRAAARVGAGEAALAIAELEEVLERAPAWIHGHEQLAQFYATQGRGDEATSSIQRALQRFPRGKRLWETWLYVELRRGRYADLKPILERARGAGIGGREFRIYDAVHAAEFDDETFPAVLFDPGPPDVEQALGRWRIRHLLRLGALDAALKLIDQQMRFSPSLEIFAYAATAWRAANDPQAQWLEGDPRIIGVFDLTDSLPPLDKLASTLRALHVAKGEYLDQSVRGGTQTDGPLFSRIDPVIRDLRKAIVGAVETYAVQLPPIDPRHPLLRERRDRRIRFSGSWSVRLGSGGRHSNHLHPMGWISSALYVTLPEKTAGEPADAGWLTLGEPDDQLRMSMPPWRKVEPKAGQLVLFPSWMWHGTVPFPKGERLTVAFDVAPPR